MKLLDSNIIIAEAARTDQEDLPLFLDEGFCFLIVTRNLQDFRHIRELGLLPA